MIVELEEAIVAYYNTRLEADATLTGKSFTVLASNGDDVIPEDAPTVVVKVTETPSKMQTLVDAQVDTLVAVPMDMNRTETGAATALVSLFETAVRRAWDETTHPTATADVNALIDAGVTDYVGGGFDAQGWVEDREGNMAMPTFRVHVGLVRG